MVNVWIVCSGFLEWLVLEFITLFWMLKGRIIFSYVYMFLGFKDEVYFFNLLLFQAARIYIYILLKVKNLSVIRKVNSVKN